MAYTNIAYSATLQETGELTDASENEEWGVFDTTAINHGICPKVNARYKKAIAVTAVVSTVVLVILFVYYKIELKQGRIATLSYSQTQLESYRACMEGYVFDGMPSTSQLADWIQRLPKCLPDFVEVFNLGKTFENRSLRGLRLGRRENKGVKFGHNSTLNEKVIWLQAGIHSKEWITVTSIVHVANKIIALYLSHNSTARVAHLNYQWYLMPLANPDGYNYSRMHDKEWRKNRRLTFQSSSRKCFGVDLNRNWPFRWKNDTGDEHNNDPCGDNYAGSSALSEPETKGVSEMILNLRNQSNFVMFISLHSLGQKWLLPWSYTVDTQPQHYNSMHELAAEGVLAIEKRHKTKWTLGQASVVVYICSGTALDWVASLGTPFVYTLELRPADHDTYGHYPPMKEVVKSGEEFWSGLSAIVRRWEEVTWKVILRRND